MDPHTELAIHRAARLISQEREHRGWTREDACIAGGVGIMTGQRMYVPAPVQYRHPEDQPQIPARNGGSDMLSENEKILADTQRELDELDARIAATTAQLDAEDEEDARVAAEYEVAKRAEEQAFQEAMDDAKKYEAT